MKRRNDHKSSLYQYLDEIGVLENGTEEEIQTARALYWKNYKRLWRKQKRKVEKELRTSWTADELKDLTKASKLHKMSRVKYIKSATIAYSNKAFIVPDKIEVRRIAQLLAMNYNLIQEMIDEKALHLQTGKIILARINELERAMLISLHSPKSLEQMVTETVQTNPLLKPRLFQLLESIS